MHLVVEAQLGLAGGVFGQLARVATLVHSILFQTATSGHEQTRASTAV
jgi:hypothetical protein